MKLNLKDMFEKILILFIIIYIFNDLILSFN